MEQLQERLIPSIAAALSASSRIRDQETLQVVDVERVTFTPRFCVSPDARFCNKEVVWSKVASGCAVPVYDASRIEAQAFGGWTPLHNVVDISLCGDPVPGDEPTERIRLLLERGALVSAEDDQGRTPLASDA